MNGSNDNITVRKVIEKMDHSTIPKILADITNYLLRKPGSEQFVCDLMKSLSGDEADLIKYVLETAKFIIKESFEFFERRKNEYDVALRWKRILGFASPEELLSRASDLAFRDMTRMAGYFSALQKDMIAGTIEMRRELTSSYEGNIRRMIDRGNERVMELPRADLKKLEKGGRILLDHLMEYEDSDVR